MDGCGVNVSISALACAIAKGKTTEEITALGAFFTQLGDSLETIVAFNAVDCKNEWKVSVGSIQKLPDLGYNSGHKEGYTK